MSEVFQYRFFPDWPRLSNQISRIERFDAAWPSIQQREERLLRQFKEICTIESTGASTRLFGSMLNDREVLGIIRRKETGLPLPASFRIIDGYARALGAIKETFRDLPLTPDNILQFQRIIESASPDQVHPGWYDLVVWYKYDKETPRLVKCAVLTYTVAAFDPLLSRLLTNLVLLQEGFTWVQFISIEAALERKKEVYGNLIGLPDSDITYWVEFFLDSIENAHEVLLDRLSGRSTKSSMSPREKLVYEHIDSYPGCRSGDIAEALQIPQPTIKKILTDMYNRKLLYKHGVGTGTNYSVQPVLAIKNDLLMHLTDSKRRQEFTLETCDSFLEIKKIILTPKFEWVRPEEWSAKLMNQGLYIEITCVNSKGATASQPYMVSSYNSPYYFQPVFTLIQPINIPVSLWGKWPFSNECPIKVAVELKGNTDIFDFDVLIVYDQA